MCALIIGGDKVTTLSNVLKELGVTKINHWDARNKSSACKKTIPQDTQCVVMLTSYLNHNAMKHFKSEAKKRDLPVICSKQSASCLYEEYVKIMGITDCKDCYAKDNCKQKDIK
jgi:hypothetical protein